VGGAAEVFFNSVLSFESVVEVFFNYVFSSKSAAGVLFNSILSFKFAAAVSNGGGTSPCPPAPSVPAVAG
jgi:hypothetical protein